MLSIFGRFGHKYKFIILLGWVAFTILYIFVAPSLSEVGVTDQSQFLPDKTESAYARELLNTKFASATESPSSSGLIVVYNENGLTQSDMDRAKSIRTWLTSANGPGAVKSVASVFDYPDLRSSLVSNDNTTMMMSVGFSVPALDDAAKQAVKEIREQFKLHPGTSFYFTGTVGFLYDLFDSIQRTIDKTTLVTIILVIVLLLIVYRSPIAALVPLIAIGCSFIIARGIIGFLAQAGVPVSTVTDAYMVVTIFGVGTDYCLFIISRFREELAQGDPKQRLEFTMRHIGPVIVASAITVIIAFLCLSISKFGMTRTSGWALAIGITITLIAGLTLVPALISLFGRYLFWPLMKPPVHKQRRYGWARIGEWVAHHPVITAAPIIIILILPYFALPKLDLSANTLTQLPKEVEASRGFNVVREHFPVGELSPLYLLLESRSGSLLTPDSLQDIKQVAQSLKSVGALSQVDYFAGPGSQLIALGTQINGFADTLGVSGGLDISKFSLLQSISGDLQTVALRYPGVTRSTNFTGAINYLAQISPMLEQLGAVTPAGLAQIVPRIKEMLHNLGNALTSLGNEFELNGDSPFIEWLKSTYFSTDGTVTRIDLILATDPYSDAASLSVKEIREEAKAAVSTSGLKDVTPYIGGETALHADMLKTSEDDFTIVIVVTSIGILAVIIILLRSLLAPFYMVVTVLFNFGATLGITAWLFRDVLKYDNLINMLPVLVFVMLAAVGADYNIFLVSRIREEAVQKSIKEAVHYAVASTGSVITSCGIILAGTFATLMTSSFPMVLEIGAAIAIGVMIDTFLVRALLVPALAALFGRLSWWPSSLSRNTQKD